MQVVFVGALDLDGRDLADPQGSTRCHVNGAVDLRRVAAAAAPGEGRGDPRGRPRPMPRVDLVDDHLLTGPYFALETSGRDRLLPLHEAMPAFVLHLGRNRRREVVGDCPFYRLIAKAADAIELGCFQP